MQVTHEGGFTWEGGLFANLFRVFFFFVVTIVGSEFGLVHCCSSTAVMKG